MNKYRRPAQQRPAKEGQKSNQDFMLFFYF